MRLLFLAPILLPIFVHADCSDRNSLSALKMSSVFFNGERVKPFLLDHSGKEYVPCSGTPIFKNGSRNNLEVGVRTLDGELHVVDYLDLLSDSKNYHQSLGGIVQLPEILPPPKDSCSYYENYLSAQTQALLETLNSAPEVADKNQVLKLIYDFNRDKEICESLDKAEDRKTELLNSWSKYCQGKNQKLCQRAMEVDLLNRTAVFEAHALGDLEQIEIKSSADLKKNQFPISRCEKRFIAMTLRNRAGSNLKEKQRDVAKPISGSVSTSQLKKFSPYFVQGLNDDMYNIWKPKYVNNSYIAACFAKGSRLPESAIDGSRHRFDVFQESYLSSLGDTYEALFNQASFNASMTFKNQHSGEVLDLDTEIQHYFHPMAMPKCFFDQSKESGWEIRSKAEGVVACRKVAAHGSQTEDCALFKNEPHRINKETGEIQFLQVDEKAGSFSSRWTESWKVVQMVGEVESPEDYYRVKESSSDTNAAKRSKARAGRYCEGFGPDAVSGNEAPTWALGKSSPKYIEVECDIDGRKVSIGSQDDPRILPVMAY